MKLKKIALSALALLLMLTMTSCGALFGDPLEKEESFTVEATVPLTDEELQSGVYDGDTKTISLNFTLNGKFTKVPDAITGILIPDNEYGEQVFLSSDAIVLVGNCNEAAQNMGAKTAMEMAEAMIKALDLDTDAEPFSLPSSFHGSVTPDGAIVTSPSGQIITKQSTAKEYETDVSSSYGATLPENGTIIVDKVENGTITFDKVENGTITFDKEVILNIPLALLTAACFEYDVELPGKDYIGICYVFSNGTDFWMMETLCPAEDFEDMQPYFDDWAESVTFGAFQLVGVK